MAQTTEPRTKRTMTNPHRLRERRPRCHPVGERRPLYQALVDRELKCPKCLEKLLLDRSDLGRAAERGGREPLHHDDPSHR